MVPTTSVFLPLILLIFSNHLFLSLVFYSFFFTCMKMKKVYFATESPRLIDMAKAFFAPFQNALYVSDKMVQPLAEAANMTNLDNEPYVDEQVGPGHVQSLRTLTLTSRIFSTGRIDSLMTSLSSLFPNNFLLPSF